jgi:hypothetical protein
MAPDLQDWLTMAAVVLARFVASLPHVHDAPGSTPLIATHSEFLAAAAGGAAEHAHLLASLLLDTNVACYVVCGCAASGACPRPPPAWSPPPQDARPLPPSRDQRTRDQRTVA